MSKVKDFKGFMSGKAVNEQDNDGMEAGMQYGANPEDEELNLDAEGEEGEEGAEGEEEEEELTMEDLKAMIEDLTERVIALEPEVEEEGEEGEEGAEGEEGEEGEEAAE